MLALCAAGWSTSNTNPTTLAGGNGDQVQPKVVVDAQGNLFVTWYDAPGGYDVRAQQFTSGGEAVWTAPSLVMNNAFSSTQDYQAFRGAPWAVASQQGAGPGAMVAAVGSDGVLQWQRTVSSASASVPKGNRADDGYLWSAWVEGSGTKVQRLAQADGTTSFATPIGISQTGSVFSADVEPALSGNGAVVSTVRYASFSSAKVLWANLVNPDGSQPWGSAGKQVFSGSSLQFGNFPEFERVPGLGYLFTYYKTGPLQSWVQVLDENGARVFGNDGIAVTTSTANERTAPSAVSDGNFIYVCWIDHVPNSSLYGVYAQCISAKTGELLWGETGLALAAIETIYSYTGAVAHLRPEGVVFGWVRTPAYGNDSVEAVCLDSAGAVIWDRRTLASNVSSKGRMRAYGVPYGTLIVWEDGIGTGSADVRAARVGLDGALGPVANGSPDLDGSGLVDGADLGMMLSNWSSEFGESVADLNRDLMVDGADLGMLLSAWGI